MVAVDSLVRLGNECCLLRSHVKRQRWINKAVFMGQPFLSNLISQHRLVFAFSLNDETSVADTYKGGNVVVTPELVEGAQNYSNLNFN